MGTSYTHYVFQTLTYNRHSSCRHQRWWSVSNDTTRYLQSVRRKFKTQIPIEHIRVIEFHKDYNPHVHVLLHFPNALTLTNSRFFDRRFFDVLQGLWTHGFSKPESLRFPDGAFAYVLKYFLKQIANRTTNDDFGLSSNSDESTSFPPKIWPLKGKRSVIFAMPIRLLAWSRGMQYLYQLRQQQQLLKETGKYYPLSSKLVSRKIGKQSRLSNCSQVFITESVR